ncbi:SpoVR family protein [bacterium]|nr:SpoVR family protein [bacterium]
MRELPEDLKILQEEIEGYARGYGLDFFTQIFEVLDYDEINMVAAYGGFPTRYPHWRFGMEYEQLAKGYEWGLQKIYEMVINNDPCYAYLLESNGYVDQKIVMAHVYGHNDFFKNNYWFAHTNRKMMDEMANHATRVRRYIERYGLEEVESFIDICLPVENLIDPHSPYIQRSRDLQEPNEMPADEPLAVKKLKSKDYMDDFINPKEFLAEQLKKLTEEQEKKKNFPEQPEKDVLAFLIEYAPLTNWQRDLLSIVREEAYYFAPQGMTKIMNEGWASYWHSKIMTERAAHDHEIVDYADHCAGVLATSGGRLNPYKLGIELLRDIEDRWNKGKFGREYDECTDLVELQRWDKKLGLGRKKIFEVRKLYNDVMFLDEFLTPEFCERMKLFTYEFNSSTDQYEITEREFKKVKQKLLFQLTHHGLPYLSVVDGNFENRAELLLQHKFEGIELKIDEARATMESVYKIWKRPVNVATVVNNEETILTFDGNNHTEKRSSYSRLAG